MSTPPPEESQDSQLQPFESGQPAEVPETQSDQPQMPDATELPQPPPSSVPAFERPVVAQPLGHSHPSSHSSHSSGRRRSRKRRGMSQQAKRERQPITSRPWFIISSFLLALGFAAWLTYFMWNLEQSPRRPAYMPSSYEPVPVLGSEDRKEAAEMVAAAYRKVEQGDLYEAYMKFKAIHQLHPDLPGILTEMSRIAPRLDMTEDADRIILNAQKAGRQSGEIGLLLAINAARFGKAETIFSNFENAHLSDPTNADILHLWGDALRAAGKNLEAMEKYKASLLRSNSISLSYLTNIKLRLARLETGDQEERSKAVRAALLDNADGATLLVAAAAALLPSDDPVDAEERSAMLREAQRRIPAPLYDYLIRDPIFQTPEAADAFGDLVASRKNPGADWNARALP